MAPSAHPYRCFWAWKALEAAAEPSPRSLQPSLLPGEGGRLVHLRGVIHQALGLLPAVPLSYLPTAARMAGEWNLPSPTAQTRCQHSPCPELPHNLLCTPTREPPGLPQPLHLSPCAHSDHLCAVLSGLHSPGKAAVPEDPERAADLRWGSLQHGGTGTVIQAGLAGACS